MPPLTREQLAVRRSTRRRDDRLRHRRLAVSVTLPLLGLALLAVVIGLIVGGSSSSASSDAPGTVAPPVLNASAPASGSAGTKADVVLARADGVDLHLPIDRSMITAIAFRAVDDPGAVAMTPSSGGVSYRVASNDSQSGPDTGSVDVGAPAGTPVFSPVDGTVASVSPYLVAGRQQGYQVGIAPSAAADVQVELTHLESPAGSSPPAVGTPVRAGLKPALGQVRDFSHVAQQDLSQYTSDSGNHVHIEVVRISSDIAP
jgi:hypothetical protein